MPIHSRWVTAGDVAPRVFGGAPALSRRGATLVVPLGALLFSVTVMQRFGINFGRYSLNAALPAMYFVLVVAALGGVLAISLPRLMAYGLGISVALASTIANEGRSSVSSLLLLVTIYLPFVFVVAPTTFVNRTMMLRLFLNVALFCALAGICQFYAQFFVRPAWLFDFTAYLPPFLRGPSGFNTVIPVGSLFKSNGFFFREPSGFSFIMALALVAECVSYKRTRRILCFALALLLTYSGTGLLAVLVGMIIPLNRRTMVRIAIFACGAAVAFLLLDDALNLSFTLGRLGEFDSQRSSGYIRYIAPGRLLADTLNTEAWTFWLGHGPGSISRAEAGFEFHDPTWAKVIYEYGVLGLVTFVGLVLLALQRGRSSLRVRAVLFAGWLIMGGHLLSPEQNYLMLALVGMLPDAETVPPMAQPELQPTLQPVLPPILQPVLQPVFPPIFPPVLPPVLPPLRTHRPPTALPGVGGAT